MALVLCGKPRVYKIRLTIFPIAQYFLNTYGITMQIFGYMYLPDFGNDRNGTAEHAQSRILEPNMSDKGIHIFPFQRHLQIII